MANSKFTVEHVRLTTDRPFDEVAAAFVEQIKRGTALALGHLRPSGFCPSLIVPDHLCRRKLSVVDGEAPEPAGPVIVSDGRSTHDQPARALAAGHQESPCRPGQYSIDVDRRSSRS